MPHVAHRTRARLTRSRLLLTAVTALGLLAPTLAVTSGTAEAKATRYGKVTFVADGDTIDVNIKGDGTSRPVRVRFIGIQAMELKRYALDLKKIRGECWAPTATRYLAKLILHRKVRLTSHLAENVPGRQGPRAHRYVAVKFNGQWTDVGSLMLQAGLALPEPGHDETGHNKLDQSLAQQAALDHAGMWGDPTHCGVGPAQEVPLSVNVMYDPDGNEVKNPNLEYVRVTNGGTSDVSLGGWWLRDTSNRGYQAHGYTFPKGATVRAGESVQLRVGRGDDDADTFHWGWTRPAFVNPTGAPKWMGDGAFLFDPDGDLRAWDMYPCFVGC